MLPSPIKICIVDDDNNILIALKTTFEHAGYDVVSTNDPHNALPLLERSQPDAIVLDLMMPELSGWEVLQAIRSEQRFQATPIILLSALSDPSHRVRGLRSGADDYVVKPFDPDELVVRVETRISRKMRTRAGITGRLEVHSIQEIVQSLENGAKTGELKIDAEGFLGTILLKDGKVVEARCGEYGGTMAVQTILELGSGRFQFTAREVTGGPQGGFSFMPLLMEEAWVADELETRQACLPPPEAAMAPIAEPGALLTELAEFPVAEVWQYLFEHPGTTLKTLLDQCFDSPQRVQLMIAWMREEELLELAPSAVSEDRGELDESLDVVIRELFQEYLFRGFALERMEVRFFVQAGAWDSLAPMLVEIADPLLNGGDRSARRQIFLDRAGKLALTHPDGHITLSFETLSPRSAEQPLHEADAVVLWLEDNASGASLAAVASRIETRAQPGAGLLFIAPSEETRQRATKILGESSRWRLCAELPVGLRQLFTHLIQAAPV